MHISNTITCVSNNAASRYPEVFIVKSDLSAKRMHKLRFKDRSEVPGRFRKVGETQRNDAGVKECLTSAVVPS